MQKQFNTYVCTRIGMLHYPSAIILWREPEWVCVCIGGDTCVDELICQVCFACGYRLDACCHRAVPCRAVLCRAVLGLLLWLL